MNRDELNKQLQRYQNGCMNEAERHQLEEAVGKAEVLAAASRQGTALRRRKMGGIGIACVALVVVSGILFGNHLQTSSTVPQFAEETGQPVPIIADSMLEVEESTSVAEVPVRIASVQQEQTIHQQPLHEDPIEQMTVESAALVAVLPEENEFQVLCNLQCDADSVINDVWEFLKA